MGGPVSYQHQELASGRWAQMGLLEQMANIGSEVDRALNWKAKKNEALCLKSVDRALELLDLSLGATREYPRLKEFARARELLVDYFYADNEYRSTEAQWRAYFLQFAVAFRK